MLKQIYISMLLVGLLHGAEFITPPEYDNMVNSIESDDPVLISNTSPLFSTGTRVLGGINTKYRCVTVPKIFCSARTPKIILNISDVSLRDSASNQVVNIYAQDTFSEDAGSSWRVCGGALGGVMWDDSTITVTTNASYVSTITHTYVPNANADTYWFFTSHPTLARRGGVNSYMVVETHQVCR